MAHKEILKATHVWSPIQNRFVAYKDMDAKLRKDVAEDVAAGRLQEGVPNKEMTGFIEPEDVQHPSEILDQSERESAEALRSFNARKTVEQAIPDILRGVAPHLTSSPTVGDTVTFNDGTKRVHTTPSAFRASMANLGRDALGFIPLGGFANMAIDEVIPQGISNHETTAGEAVVGGAIDAASLGLTKAIPTVKQAVANRVSGLVQRVPEYLRNAFESSGLSKEQINNLLNRVAARGKSIDQKDFDIVTNDDVFVRTRRNNPAWTDKITPMDDRVTTTRIQKPVSEQIIEKSGGRVDVAPRHDTRNQQSFTTDSDGTTGRYLNEQRNIDGIVKTTQPVRQRKIVNKFEDVTTLSDENFRRYVDNLENSDVVYDGLRAMRENPNSATMQKIRELNTVDAWESFPNSRKLDRNEEKAWIAQGARLQAQPVVDATKQIEGRMLKPRDKFTPQVVNVSPDPRARSSIFRGERDALTLSPVEATRELYVTGAEKPVHRTVAAIRNAIPVANIAGKALTHLDDFSEPGPEQFVVPASSTRVRIPLPQSRGGWISDQPMGDR